MKKIGILLFAVLLLCCKKNKTNELNTNAIPKIYNSKTNSISKNEVLYVNGKKFSGYLFELFTDSKDTLSIERYLNGKLNGVSKKWYPSKQLKEERFFLNGNKNGKQIAYWENGNKKFDFIASNDAYEGELKEWSFDGKLSHLGHFKKGQEEGVQKLWYDTGKIRANYVIKNGKRYGLLGTKNCRNVSDSIFSIK